MKKLLLLPLVLAFTSNAALAANSVDLRVTGTITPSACDISVAGGGTFDLGSISSGDLDATTKSALPAVGGQTLNIACTGATQVAFNLIDNRTDSLPASGDSTQLGLGVDSANNPIGYYRLDHDGQFMVDGAPGRRKMSQDGGATWTSSGGTFNTLPIFAFDLSGSNDTAPPSPVSNISIPLKIYPTIQPTNTLDTSAEISIDGSATIELVYL